ASGARVVQYIPQNAYLVWTASENEARALSHLAAQSNPIQYFADFDPTDALAPALDPALSSSAAVPVTVQLYNHGPRTADDLVKVKALADAVLGEAVEVLGGTYINVRLAVPGTRLKAMTNIDAVVNVEPFIEPQLFDERQGQIVAGNLTGTRQSPSGPG